MKKRILSLMSLALVTVLLSSLPALASQFRGSLGGSGLYLIDSDGDGIGDARPTPGTGQGVAATNFVDADNNGLCDTYEAGGQQLLDGSGAAAALGQRARAGRTR
ncbi:MAG: hypothetical protein AB7T15_05705 [Desulfuromonas sp.]